MTLGGRRECLVARRGHTTDRNEKGHGSQPEKGDQYEEHVGFRSEKASREDPGPEGLVLVG